MQFQIISLFPQLFDPFLHHGVVGRGFQMGKAFVNRVNPRDFTEDNYQTVDDRPYGGGPGMVMMAEPLYQAIQFCKQSAPSAPVVYMSAQGEPMTQSMLQSFSGLPGMILLAGRYEGIDQRLIDQCVDHEVCVGDYVLSGGEVPAMALIDGVMRLLPGVLGDAQSAEQDSFVNGVLDCPHYTRPEVWREQVVPPVLLSGDHAKIEAWRREQALALTKQRRPELLG